MKTPQTTSNVSTTLPIKVLGKKSPYPTVVIVIIVSQMAF